MSDEHPNLKNADDAIVFVDSDHADLPLSAHRLVRANKSLQRELTEQYQLALRLSERLQVATGERLLAAAVMRQLARDISRLECPYPAGTAEAAAYANAISQCRELADAVSRRIDGRGDDPSR
jgi:hypothetical protein